MFFSPFFKQPVLGICLHSHQILQWIHNLHFAHHLIKAWLQSPHTTLVHCHQSFYGRFFSQKIWGLFLWKFWINYFEIKFLWFLKFHVLKTFLNILHERIGLFQKKIFFFIILHFSKEYGWYLLLFCLPIWTNFLSHNFWQRTFFYK